MKLTLRMILFAAVSLFALASHAPAQGTDRLSVGTQRNADSARSMPATTQRESASAFPIPAALTGLLIAQTERTFYLACESKSQMPNQDFRREEITVKNWTDDVLTLQWLNYVYSFKKVPGFNFLKVSDGILGDVFAYKVDDNSFFLLSPDGGEYGDAITYYHIDRKKADERDINKRCALDVLAQFKPLVKTYVAEGGRQYDADTKAIFTEFAKNYKSQRTDPALEKGIRLWWQGDPNAPVVNPLLRVYFLQPNFDYVRNEYGVVLRKTLDAMYVYKMKNDGKCYAQWRSFGYESLGGGAFGDEVKAWVKRGDVGVPDYRKVGDRQMDAGSQYEVDCAPFQ